ncbi:hypothetical protein [Actinoplanes teichomyceticus]|uniref:Type VII secretion system (Wss) protein ESAT-6 n=1 Tax=Actinoplanes teichomyceticus TaxID=1867 RepID=A0A561WB94_ACTTI|nr:hypothetical protein [Actinoplanes teichomyceticus]TWG21136.1 hypothetical protein FHX34_103666 [Actinoplanes teichomyceticus]GIF14957.1 hypothetical protein Ate01nite_49890 [Actinoplanes teichomyceticus]
MSDEFYAKYSGVSHEKLYADLKAGDPEQIDGLAATWSSMTHTLADLARTLDADLGKLAATWDSAGGAEFTRRLTLVCDHARLLSEEYQSVGDGLTGQARYLREAQSKAEDPEETDDNDQMFSNAAKGGLVAGLPGLLVGGAYGHQKDKEEQEKAHKRMITLVAGLAAQYQTTQGSTWDIPLRPPSPELPGTIDNGGAGTGSAARPAGARGAGLTGPGGPKADRDIATPTHAGTGPGTGSGGPADTHLTTAPTVSPVDGPGGTGLAGAGPASGSGGGVGPSLTTATGTSGAGAGNTGWLAGGGGLALTAGLIGGSTLAAKPMLTGGAGPAGGAGGVRPVSASGAPRPETARASSTGSTGSTGAGAGRGTATDLGIRDGAHGGRGNASSVGAARGAQGHQDEADERTTWLTEDEMVWGGNDAPPPVLGG